MSGKALEKHYQYSKIEGTVQNPEKKVYDFRAKKKPEKPRIVNTLIFKLQTKNQSTQQI